MRPDLLTQLFTLTLDVIQITSFESGILLLGTDPKLVKDYIVKDSPVLTFVDDEFGGNHMITTPNDKDARAKAKVIKKRLEEVFFQTYNIMELVLEIADLFHL